MHRRAFNQALLLALLAPHVPAAERIRIAIGEWSPFIGAELPGNGVIARLVSEVFALQGIAVEYGFFPWKRAYEEVRRGRWQASAVWGRTAERERECWFSQVVYSDEVVLFYNKARPLQWNGDPTDLQSLHGLRIGLPLGSAKSQQLAEAERRGLVKYQIGGDELSNLRMLAAGRIDALDIIHGSASYLIRTRLSREERERLASSPSLSRWDYHLILSRQDEHSPRYLALFDQGLAQLRRSGRYEQIWAEFRQGH